MDEGADARELRDASLGEIRSRLLRVYLKAVAVILGVGVVILTVLQARNLTAELFVAHGFVAGYAILAWSRAPEVVRRWGFVLLSSGFMISVLFLQGFGVGQIAAGCTVPVTSYVLVGAHAGLAAALLWGVAIVGLGLAGTLGGYTPPGANEVVIAALAEWPQVLLVNVVTLGPVLIVAAGVLSNLERTLEAKTSVVDKLRMAQETLAQNERLRTLGIVAGGIAHDINNTLTVIMAEMEALEMPEESRRGILEATEGAAQMTRQLLQSAGANLLQLQRLRLPGDLESTLRSLRRVLPGHVELVEEVPQDGLAVHADRVLLRQAVINLAINARDAMPDGGTLTVRIERQTVEGRDFVALCVVDTGTGMEPSVVARATEPLFTTKPLGKGTGLGLSNVKSMMEAIGGKLDLRSALGRGTEARLLLPMADGGVESTAAERESRRANLRLLLLEDNVRLRALMASALEREGHTVRACATLAEAVSALEETEFDGLVSDIVVPDGSGVQLARRFRLRAPRGDVLLVSAFSPSASDRAAILENEFRLLRKPFRMADLVSSVVPGEDLGWSAPDSRTA